MGIKDPNRIYCPFCGREGKKERAFNPEKLLVPRRCENCGRDYFYFWQVGSYYLSVTDKHDFWNYNRLNGVSDDFVGCPGAYQLRYSERVNRILREANPPVYYSNEVLAADVNFVEGHPEMFNNFVNNQILRLCNEEIDFSKEVWLQPVEYFYQFQDRKPKHYNGLGLCLLTRSSDGQYLFYRKPVNAGSYPNQFGTIGSGALFPEDLEQEVKLGHWDLKTLLQLASTKIINREINIDLNMEDVAIEVLGFGMDNYRAGNLDFFIRATIDRHRDELPEHSMEVTGTIHSRYDMQFVSEFKVLDFLRNSKNPQLIYMAHLLSPQPPSTE